MYEAKKLAVNNRIKLSTNFSGNEFECHGNNCCGHAMIVNPRLLGGLELLRKTLAEKYSREIPVSPTCVFRCKSHNTTVGGVENSEHMHGLAADINTQKMGLPEIEVARIARNLKDAQGRPIFKRVGVYGVSYINTAGKLVSKRGYNNKVGFIHLGISDKEVNGTKLPSYWGDWR